MKHILSPILLVVILFFTRCSNTNQTQIPDGAFPIIYKGHLYIEGVADSNKGNFVFDTGASNLYFDSIFYADNNFTYENTFEAKLPGAGSTPQTVIVVEDTVQFTFGEYIYNTPIVPVLKLKPILGDIADGILGMEYFYNSILEINYEKEYMKMYASIDSFNVQGWSKIELSKKDNRLFIPLEVTINDTTKISGEYQLDFGSGGTVSLTSFVSNKYKLIENVKNKVSYFTKYGGVGGESSSYDFFAKSVKIGDFKFYNVDIDVSVDTAGAMASDEHFGLLGNGIYERFDMCIDFIHNELYLKPNNNFNKKFEASKLGFSYVDRGQTLNSWIVTGLYGSSNAQKAGLEIDDKIISVNGVNVSEITYELQRTFFDDIDKINLNIERKDSLIEINFTLIPILSTASDVYK